LRDQKQVGFFEKAGVWLGIWTGPKGVDIQRPPRRKVAAVAAAVLVVGMAACVAGWSLAAALV